MHPIHRTAPPPRKSALYHPDGLVRSSIVDHEREEGDRRRIVLAALVIVAGVTVAGLALWQARTARTVYVPVYVESPAAAAPPPPSIPVEDAFAQNSRAALPPTAPPSRVVVTASAMPMSQPVANTVAMPTPVDYAARDRQVADLKRRTEEIDETIRRVRADPHWYGIVKGSTDTSRQQSSDAYLDQLDRQRNDLRRQKWALEGR